MNYNGKEVKVTCNLQNDTIKITIIGNDLKLPHSYDNINEAARFLAAEYGGTKAEAALALNNYISEVEHLPESMKNTIVRNAIYQWIPDKLKGFVDVNRIVQYAIPDELKDLIVRDKLRQSNLII